MVDRVAPNLASALEDAELVLLAAPPLTCLDLIDEIAGPLRSALPPQATVTDAASAKARIVARADERELPFVGGHPMAGREISGYGAALPDLFEGRPWVVVPGRYARPYDTARLEVLILGCGAQEFRMEAEVHDRAVAAISHMPLVVSAALVEAVSGGPDSGAAATLAATGWASMTRLARGEPGMGAGIAATNAPAIVDRLRDLRAVLDSWIADLERKDGPNAEELRARFEEARRELEAWSPQ